MRMQINQNFVIFCQQYGWLLRANKSAMEGKRHPMFLSISFYFGISKNFRGFQNNANIIYFLTAVVEIICEGPISSTVSR